jgi:hypothetical protein
VSDPGLISAARPAFPGVAISRGDSFVPLKSVGQITTPTSRALSRFYRDLHIFDSLGALWPVELVSIEKAGLFRKVFNSQVQVQLRLGQPKADGLETAAEWLCGLIDADPDDLYGQHMSHDALKARFRACASPTELIECATKLGGP